MRKKQMLASAIIIFIPSFVALFAGPLVHRLYLSAIGCIGTLFSFFLFTGSITYKQFWKCDKCKNSFSIGVWTYLFSNNGRRNQKRLHCPTCNRKTWCTGLSE